MKKRIERLLLYVMLISVVISAGCTNEIKNTENGIAVKANDGQIYLYGEAHGEEKILEKEFELWYDYYHNQGMRHLFIENPYYTGEFLNLWMQSDDDKILDEVYDEWVGTLSHEAVVKTFYKRIKKECPETVFHGTDVGHQFSTIGERYLEYLTNKDLESTDQYRLTMEAIEQGKEFYKHSDDVYRENKMVENFVREFDGLDDESIMGIYGSAHTGLNDILEGSDVSVMANQLQKQYDATIYTEDLSSLAIYNELIRVDVIELNGKSYEASYYGKQDLRGFKDYLHREYWRLEGAYVDFKDNR